MSKQNKHLPRNEVGFVDLTGPATRCRLSLSPSKEVIAVSHVHIFNPYHERSLTF